MSLIDLNALRAAPLRTDPYDYLVVPEFLSAGALEQVNRDYPAIDTAANHALENLTYGAAFGALIAGIDAVHSRRTAVLLLATVYVPVLVNIRNSFISVPAQVAAGLVVLLALRALRHVLDSVLVRSYARPAIVRSAI